MIGAHATTYPLRSGVPDIAGVGRAGDLIAPEVFAVAAPLKGLFPHGGVAAGSVVACEGPAAWALAAAMVAPVVDAGAWMLVIDVAAPHAFAVEPESLREAGVALERVVRVVYDPSAGVHLADLLIAGLDGFGVVLLVDPGSLPGPAERRLRRRLADRGALVVVVRPYVLGRRTPRGASTDVLVATEVLAAEGIGIGWGKLSHRRVRAASSGRRMHGVRHVEICLPIDDVSVGHAPLKQ